MSFQTFPKDYMNYIERAIKGFTEGPLPNERKKPPELSSTALFRCLRQHVDELLEWIRLIQEIERNFTILNESPCRVRLEQKIKRGYAYPVERRMPAPFWIVKIQKPAGASLSTDGAQRLKNAYAEGLCALQFAPLPENVEIFFSRQGETLFGTLERVLLVSCPLCRQKGEKSSN